MRRVLALVTGLPETSAFRRVDTGGVTWTLDTELLATNAELSYANLMAQVPKEKRPSKPFQVVRPWKKSAPKKKATPEDIRRFASRGKRF